MSIKDYLFKSSPKKDRIKTENSNDFEYSTINISSPSKIGFKTTNNFYKSEINKKKKDLYKEDNICTSKTISNKKIINKNNFKVSKEKTKPIYNNLFNEIKKYNYMIEDILSEIQKKLQNDYELKDQKINTLSKTIEDNKTKETELQKDIDLKNKKIEELENENKKKDEELMEQKKLNLELTYQEEQLKKQFKELEVKFTEAKEKIKNIQNNESKYKDKDFKNLEEISKGAYGTLYSAYNIKDEIDICLKKIDINYMARQYNNNSYPENSCFKDLNNEIEILKLLSSQKNSVKYFGDYQIIKEKTIIMEKCDEDLQQYLIKRNKAFNTDEIKKIFVELNELFKIMNKNNIVHRDLKLRNFLIKYTNDQKTEFIVKLCDYGIGKFLGDTNYNFSGMKGSVETIAPEIFLSKTQKYENNIDIFSLGVIFYQLSHNLKHPFKDNEYDNNLFIKYYESYDEDKCNINFDPSIENENFKNLVISMLKLNPKNRITWEQYFEHPFFK